MKIFTHSYKVTLRENGHWCWKSEGWVEDTRGRKMWTFFVIGLAIALKIWPLSE